MFISPQQAAVADIVGSKARGGTAVATFQMMSDFGAILGSLAVGQIARAPLVSRRRSSISGVILLVAAVGWVFAPETRPRTGSRAHAGPSAGSGGRRRGAVTSGFEPEYAGGVTSTSTTSGAMAQLVAHHTGSVGVRGSNPLSSTVENPL